MGTSRPTVDLGSYVVGEVPPSLTYQFRDASAQPIDLTGFTVTRFQWSEVIRGQFTLPTVESATITDAVGGRVSYTWNGDEFATTGDYAGLFFVNDGTIQYASDLLTWQVCTSVGVPPIV